MKPPEPRPLELATLWSLPIYLASIVVYVIVVLQYLGGPLEHLRDVSVVWYAIACLGLVMLQAVVLDALASWLARLLIRHPHER
jgi:hypothetical protein